MRVPVETDDGMKCYCCQRELRRCERLKSSANYCERCEVEWNDGGETERAEWEVDAGVVDLASTGVLAFGETSQRL